MVQNFLDTLFEYCLPSARGVRRVCCGSDESGCRTVIPRSEAFAQLAVVPGDAGITADAAGQAQITWFFGRQLIGRKILLLFLVVDVAQRVMPIAQALDHWFVATYSRCCCGFAVTGQIQTV